ncbi:hypothetical protein [Desulfosarcina ovata]|uniref:Uncharacterized protein n=1 Tax=Desulfosarcina ovata subsp. ovata TaxID=2752305 RepID=A0A5K8AKU9_9BACT|nr:hypothetical protein [Desulfosarcina ovata]BBO93352.1 hypothetical protein DSCOOX_65320 [Desulfosarcina ovata subsp. ovata]
MQALHVNFTEATRAIENVADASPEPWQDVCERFDDDVHRIMDVTDQAGYTALYACYDENNQPVYYLVEEGKALARLRHKNFLSKLGQPQS